MKLKVKLLFYFLKNLPSSNDCAINKLADEPEFTKTENFDPKNLKIFSQIF